ncbi:mediator of RNA polymerase II transcription subunit 1 [Octopus bimaculoides]|uniref:mediator of RNA polymerase II transcription subunit 1 n=1 Tax=Octopus bimaculoides TaxID=37653 RepID=UPI0022E793C8|nr:mediator of RNA polymerase II transcription subunit 1 [Octopus bimaculoides]
MKLIYFVSPYDLLDRKTKIKHPLTIDAITEYQLGHSVTVSIEHSSLNRLQTMPLMTVVKNQDGKSLPSFSGLSNMNSCMLPACFVLTLRTPLTVLASLLQKIESITNMEVPRISEGKKLLSLLIETISCQQLFNKKELYVTLPDQQHVYFLGGHQSGIEEEGVLISKIPFTHPTNLPKILSYLRQQMLFNTAITSCIRPSAKRDLKSALVFELSALSLHQVNVSFEHPLQDSMVTGDSFISVILSFLISFFIIFSICNVEIFAKPERLSNNIFFYMIKCISRFSCEIKYISTII